MKRQKRFRCYACKGTNLVWQVYVDEFDEVQDDSGSDTWCDDCCDNVSAEEIEARAI